MARQGLDGFRCAPTCVSMLKYCKHPRPLQGGSMDTVRFEEDDDIILIEIGTHEHLPATGCLFS
jgi:hypothetical protein